MIVNKQTEQANPQVMEIFLVKKLKDPIEMLNG